MILVTGLTIQTGAVDQSDLLPPAPKIAVSPGADPLHPTTWTAGVRGGGAEAS
jgi:hypothetical protein